jgi:hypothetical protein
MAKDTELNILDCLDSTVRDLIDANLGIVNLCRELLAKDKDKYGAVCGKMLDRATELNDLTMSLHQLEIELHKAYIG